MAVLVEGISVVVKRDRIAQCYPGGWEGFVRDAPNRTLCADGELARVGFMAPDDVAAFVARMERFGLRFLVDGEPTDLVVVDQMHGPTTACGWLDFRRGPLDGGGQVAGCSLVGSTAPELITPDGWRYEDSLTAKFRFISNGSKPEVEFKGRRDGLDVYEDGASGKKLYMGRTSGESPWNPAQPVASVAQRLDALLDFVRSDRRVCPMPDAWNRLWEMLPGRHRSGGGWEPPVPLILGGWVASARAKAERLQEHVRYAADHGVLEVVDDYLRRLPRSEWYDGD